VPGKIRRLMSPPSYYCIIGTFLQEIDFRVRFADNEGAGTGGKDCPAVVRIPHACISLLPGVDYQNVNESCLVSTP